METFSAIKDEQLRNKQVGDELEAAGIHWDSVHSYKHGFRMFVSSDYLHATKQSIKAWEASTAAQLKALGYHVVLTGVRVDDFAHNDDHWVWFQKL